MPIDPEKFKQDPRSPQELAKAILDHELNPPSVDSYRLTLREKLCLDNNSQAQADHFMLHEYGSRLLWAMKALEDGSPLDRDERFDLQYALQVIDAYRQKSEIERDRSAKAANAPLANPAGSAEDRRLAEYRRDRADEMESYMVEINNLDSIEKLMRSLAHKLGIPLIEPVRGK